MPKNFFANRVRPLRLSPAAISIAGGLALLALLGVVLGTPAPPPRAVTLGSFATDLAGRTPHQRFNARRAAAAVDGAVVRPGRIFSFNKTVRGWSADRGFMKAPVSYNGSLVDDYGGGVCQTSTTIYNAALLAGLPILERHPHTFSPSYAPPGRDAAVAYAGVDLRFRNSLTTPVVVRAEIQGHMLVCRIEAAHPSPVRVALRADAIQRFTAPPGRAPAGANVPRSRWRLTGRDGVRVAVTRSFYDDHDVCVRRETVSDDTYRPISRADVDPN